MVVVVCRRLLVYGGEAHSVEGVARFWFLTVSPSRTFSGGFVLVVGCGDLLDRDDEAIQRGEYISQALLKAIQDSQYAMVIFSANYAFSKLFLMELVEIVEWEEKKRLTILPIFYHVDPSDVRNQSGSFAEVFTAHEKDPKIDKKDMDMWRNALRKAGSITGWHIHDRYESTIIQDNSIHISRELNSRFSRYDYDKLVAIDSQVDKMMELLDMESDDVLFVGIHGMGGVGKTTLAEIIYDRVSYSYCRFEGSSFISCIREESKARVDSDKQLTALAADQKWFGPGSRVIITCRDSHLLKTHGVNYIHKVEQLQKDEALQLFSLSAFKKTHPTENYKDLSMDFVNYAQGLPLALKIWTLESFGYYPGINIDVLIDKSLLTISDGTLFMHDLLKTMGHEIVRRECPEEPGRRSRLCGMEDLYHVLKNDTGTDATKAIVVEFCAETKDQRLNAKA
ncbi:hypothetical protein F2P56_037102, partial [Juglans regia]